MSYAVAVQAITTLAPIVSKTVDMRNANKQAAIELEKQKRQATHDLMVGVSPHAVQLVTECVKARITMQQIQQKSEEIALEYEKMLRETELAKQVAADAHTQQMEKINQMGENYKQVMQANQQSLAIIEQRFTHLEQLEAKLLTAMMQPEYGIEDKTLFTQELQRLHANKAQLYEAQNQLNSQNHSAFIHSCDANFEGPRTFTDVGSS
ncbi:hypothetical protein [Psychrobacter lutiphocae]|uniref:hypothetical protein n=1 Tax=Psychrobacter lutiphocae TaxID=540500 RepID=UPI000380339B|nr:hypothetical protein [Psychrobacter lutiphocae]